MSEGSALTTKQLEKAEQTVEEFGVFSDIPNASMAKELKELLTLGPAQDVITGEEMARWERLARDLGGIARRVATTWIARSEAAEIIMEVAENKDYEILRHPETLQPFSNWTEFKPFLASAIGIGTRTLDDYIKYVRVGRQVLNIPQGSFAEVSGVLTVKHVLDRCAGHGRAGPTSDYHGRLRPKTVDFRREMNTRYPNEDFDTQLAAYYWEDVAHNIHDPSAMNKSPYELADQGRQMDGAPDIRARELFDEKRGFAGYSVTIRYRDTTDIDGSVVLGEEDVYNFILEGDFLLGSVRDWMANKLGISSG